MENHMSLRLIASSATFMLFTTAGFSETINLRKSCALWEAIPANEVLKSPVAALLQCSDSTHNWMALQIVCIAETAEIKLRYKTSYPIHPPIEPSTEPLLTATLTVAENTTIVSDETPQTETQNNKPAQIPLGLKEMLFFDFPKLGVTSIVKYDFNMKDWHDTEKEPLAPLFHSLIAGNYADVSLLATGITERLPLRGSTKAIGPVVETCRIAKRVLDKSAAQKSQN